MVGASVVGAPMVDTPAVRAGVMGASVVGASVVGVAVGVGGGRGSGWRVGSGHPGGHTLIV